ncbi:holo-ACP synthase [Paratractidigestivibacter sp.]|uniref:holo-ACP synthase n=1 Tax=Paratractidigestivibacter sp. TaxID=2847316 RepID=UPI002ABDAC9F|nr:holo-ACP synthase [Paratractidigestivibacter sp.]
MIKGVGIDLVDLEEFRRICEGFCAKTDEPCAFVARTFTAPELAQARERHDACQYLAGRFAAKEAVFKAVAPLTCDGFDLRRVETIDAPSGQPQVNMGGALAETYAAAGVGSILVSITNESGFVEAIALAQ